MSRVRMVNTETHKFQDMKSEFLADPINPAVLGRSDYCSNILKADIKTM